MAFAAKTDYGLLSLLELAAIHSQGGVLQVAEIAQRQGIPDRYLEQMLATLRRAGILRSIRGPRGGYRLARPPAEIPISEVVSCLEGEGDTRVANTQRDTPESQVLAGLVERLEGARRRILEATTLQTLLDERECLAQSQAMYYI